MKPDFRTAIESHYQIKIKNSTPGPLGQIARETYVLEDDSGHRYFCKIIDRPSFIPGIVRTLPILKDMHDKGIERICYPIPHKNGLHVLVDDALVILFNFIDAKQSFDYDVHAFGRLLGQIHALTPRLSPALPAQGFSSIHFDFLEREFDRVLAARDNDPVIRSLQNLLRQHEDETRLYIAEFRRLSALCATKPSEFVITHGDVHGNVLVKSPDDFYIIDWDEMERGPAERDLWLLADYPGFMDGYQSIRPGFAPDADNMKHALLKYYLDGIAIYFEKILDEDADRNHRVEQVKQLDERRLKGWMQPLVKKNIGY